MLFLQNPSEGSVHLSGYGVELAVKSTEYKAVDDSKIKDDSSGHVQKSEEETEDEVEGFLFGKLRYCMNWLTLKKVYVSFVSFIFFITNKQTIAVTIVTVHNKITLNYRSTVSQQSLLSSQEAVSRT